MSSPSQICCLICRSLTMSITRNLKGNWHPKIEDQDLIPGRLKLSKARYVEKLVHLSSYSPGSFTCVDYDLKRRLVDVCLTNFYFLPFFTNQLGFPSLLYRPVSVIHCLTVCLTLQLQHLPILCINSSTNMAKTKPNIDAHTNKSVATNVMFKKVGPEALRQRSRYMKKTTKVSKSNNEYKPRPVAIPENTLAAEFAGKVHLI